MLPEISNIAISANFDQFLSIQQFAYIVPSIHHFSLIMGQLSIHNLLLSFSVWNLNKLKYNKHLNYEKRVKRSSNLNYIWYLEVSWKLWFCLDLEFQLWMQQHTKNRLKESKVSFKRIRKSVNYQFRNHVTQRGLLGFSVKFCHYCQS